MLARVDRQPAAAAIEHALCDGRGQLAHELRVVGQHEPARTGLQVEGRAPHPGVESELLEGAREVRTYVVPARPALEVAAPLGADGTQGLVMKLRALTGAVTVRTRKLP